jgi:phage tail sheath gpL-like
VSNTVVHEHPGVYSSYDASSVIGGKKTARILGAAAVSTTGTANEVVTLTSYAEGLSASYDDTQVDTLVTGGVTPLECVSGEVSIVRGITTRTTTGGAADKTWRELTTVQIVDDVIPALRASLRARFVRSKNTAQVRAAIRSQVMVELENKRSQEIIDSFGEVSVKASEDDPTVCLVEFSFAVAHGLNRIYLSAHITV